MKKYPRSHTKRNPGLVLPASLAFLVSWTAFSGSAKAQNIFDTGDGNWNAEELWSLGVPVTGQEVRIGGTTARIATVNTSDAVSGTAYIGYAGGSTGTVTVTGAGSLWQSSGDVTVGNLGTGILNIADGGQVTAGQVIVGDSGSGTGALNLNGTSGSRGMLTTGKVLENSGSGTVTFDGGILRASATSADFISGFESGDVILATGGGTIDSNGFNLTVSSVLSGAGGLTKAGTGTLTLSAANIYAGGTTVTAGTLKAGTASALVSGLSNAAYTVNGGTLDLNNFGLTVSSLSGTGGTVSLGSAILTVSQSATTSYAGVISGSGSLTKSGNGTLTLTGANTYSGGTTVSGGTLKAGVANALVNGTNYTVNSSTLDLNNFDLTMSSLSGTFGTVALGSAALTLNQVLSSTYSGEITGTGTVTKSGSGTLTLSGTNTYTGGTTVENGTLTLTNGGSISHALADLKIGTTGNTVLNIQGTGAATAATVHLGYGATTGTLNLNGSAGLQGILTTGGIVAESGTAVVNFDGGILRASADNAAFLPTGAGASVNLLAGGGFIDSNGFAVTTAVNIQGTGGLTKMGTGTLALGGGTTYTGGTTVKAGTLKVATGGVINHGSANTGVGRASGDSGTLTIDAGGSVTNLSGIIGWDEGATGAASVSGTWTNTNELRVGNMGTGSLTVENGGLVTAVSTTLAKYATSTGTLTLSGVAGNRGVLLSNGVTEGAGSGTILFDGGILRATANNTTFLKNFEAGDVVLGAGGGTIDSNGRNLTIPLALGGVGSLTKAGAGTLTLTMPNTYTGGTIVEAGTLKSGAASAFVSGSSNAAYTVNGGILDLSNFALTMSALSGTGGTVALGSAALTVNQAATTSYAGVISGTGSLTKAGTGALTLTGTNTFSGGTTLTVGKLVAGSNGAFGTPAVNVAGTFTTLGYADTVNLANGVVLGNNVSLEMVEGAASQSGIISQTGGTYGISKIGTGTLTLTGANTYTGGTTVTAGTLKSGAANAFVTNTAYTVNGGTLDLNNYNLSASALAGTGGAINLGTAALTVNQSTTTEYAGGITGSGSLTKSGTGTLALTGPNTYAGGTTVSAGKLLILGDDSVGTGTLTLENGVTFGMVSGGSTYLGNNVTLNGNIFLESDEISFLGLEGNISLGSSSREVTFTKDQGTFCFSVITGTGTAGISLLAGPGATATVELCDGANTYTGKTIIGNNVYVYVSKDTGAVAFGGDLQIDNGGKVRVSTFEGEATQIASTSNVLLNGTLEISAEPDSTQTFASLNGAGTLFNDGGILALTVKEGDFSGTIEEEEPSGSLRLIKTGSGTLRLSGLNTYVGGTELLDGKLITGNNGAYGAGVVSITGDSTLAYENGINLSNDLSLENNVILEVATGAEASQSGDISETGGSYSVTKTGAGALTLLGTNTYTGGTHLDEGKLLISNDNALGTGTVTLTDGTTFGVAASSGGVFLTNAVSITGNISVEIGDGDFLQFEGSVGLGSSTRELTFTQDGSDVCFMGAITGTGGVTFTAASGVNALVAYCGESKTYTGLTTVKDRVRLEITMDEDAVAIPGDLQVDAGGTVNILGLESTVTPIAPTSHVTLNGDLVFISNFAQQQTLASLTGSGTLSNGEDGIDYESLALTVLEGDFSGKIQEDPVGGALSLIKSGTGTLRLAGVNTYSGPTDLAGGTLVAGNSSAFGTGALWVTGTSTTIGYENGVNVANTLSVDHSFSVDAGIGAAAEQSGNIIESSDPVTVTKTGEGTLKLSGTNTYTGGTTLSAGKLVAGSNGAFGTGAVTITGASTTLGYGSGVTLGNAVCLINSASFEVASGTAAQSGVISQLMGSFQLAKTGAGTLQLSAVNTYTGGTIVREGTLELASTGVINHGSASMIVGQISGENGSLLIDAGATVTDSQGVLGLGAGSQGTANVSGTWTNTDKIRVGNEGTGTLNIQNGGLVSATTVELGTYATGTGTLTVQGTSGNRGVLQTSSIAERDGNGTLTVNGGILRASADNTGFIKNFEAGEATLGTNGGTIDSNGHNITAVSALGGVGALSKDGTGNLKLAGANTYEGGTIVRNGTLEVVSGGSLSHAAGNTIAGQLSGENGTLLIDAGATVTDSQGVVGLGAGSQGTASVSGTWTNSGKVRVGNEGTGTLTIQNGGLVSASTVELGTYATGTGSLSVLGTSGSRGVMLTSSISERDGNGTLTLNGGVLRASADNTGFVKNFEAGEVTLGANGGTIDSNGHNITVVSALSGSGSLAKEGTGILKMSGANTYDGTTVVRGGTLQLTSGASISQSLQNLFAGQLAGENGTLAIDAGAAVTNAQGILGSSVGAQGAANVSGTWTNLNKIRVGNEGTGTLTIQNGGLVSSTTVELGTYATGTGSMTVQGVSGNRGVMLTGSIAERDGNGTLALNGGVLRATGDNTGFVKNFEAGEVTLGTGGGFIDSNGYSIAITSGLSGTGALTKDGAGTLKLSGASTYSGGTVMNAGTLLVANASALGTGNLDLNSGALATDGIQHQINVGDDFVWKVGATIALTLTADANSEIVVVAGGIRKAGAGKAIFTLTPSGLPPGHTNFLVMTVAEGFGTLTAGSFGYTSSDPGFVGTFRISGTQLWFDDDYVSSGGLTSSGSLSSSTGSADVTAVPEPSTWMLMGLGLGMTLWVGTFRRKAVAAARCNSGNAPTA